MLQEQETFQSVEPDHANEQKLFNKQQLTNVQAKLKRFNQINEAIFLHNHNGDQWWCEQSKINRNRIVGLNSVIEH